MELRPEFQLRTMIKTMTDTVLPAIDPQNKLALEQGHLIVAMLRFLAQRLPLALRYDRCELAAYVDLAERLGGQTDGGAETRRAAGDLDRIAARAAGLLERAGLDASELQDAACEMRASVGAFVQAAYEDGTPSCKAALRRAVLDSAKADLLRERSWVLPQGWEIDPAAVPPIESLLK
jgi:hypothetical protein